LAIDDGAIEFFRQFRGQGTQASHQIDVLAHALGVGFQHRQAEVDPGLGVLGVELHGVAR